MACPPPSAPPKLRPPACVKPVACGVTFFPVALLDPVGEPWPMPLYRYFMSVSHSSEPPSAWYIRCSRGVISACRICPSTSVTTPRWSACEYMSQPTSHGPLTIVMISCDPPSLARPLHTAHSPAQHSAHPLHYLLVVAALFALRVFVRRKLKQVERRV